jgi:hypothetical protein
LALEAEANLNTPLALRPAGALRPVFDFPNGTNLDAAVSDAPTSYGALWRFGVVFESFHRLNSQPVGNLGLA